MELGKKIILLIGSVIVSFIGVGIFFILRKEENKQPEKNKKE